MCRPIPIEYETSYLRSSTGKIILNKIGVILNPKDIEEFGYWATIRTSHLMPKDFHIPTRYYKQSNYLLEVEI